MSWCAHEVQGQGRQIELLYHVFEPASGRRQGIAEGQAVHYEAHAFGELAIDTFAKSISPVLSDTDTRALLESAQSQPQVSYEPFCKTKALNANIQNTIEAAPVLAVFPELILWPALQRTLLGRLAAYIDR